MLSGKKYHIEGDVVLHENYLVGTNSKGVTQTVEQILNSLSGSVVFYNIVVSEETKKSGI